MWDGLSWLDEVRVVGFSAKIDGHTACYCLMGEPAINSKSGPLH